MAEPVEVTYTPASNDVKRALPAEVVLRADELEVGFTPRELGLIKDMFGRSYSQLVADDTDDRGRFTVTAWLYLRRHGYEPTLEDMEDILIRVVPAAPPDPTTATPGPPSPPSVTSGG